MTEKSFKILPIRKLTARCILPAMAGVLFSAVYSITDGIFVGHFVGEEALAAVNITMPLVWITEAVADMIAAGSSVRISVLLGEKDEEGASRVFTVCLALICAVSLMFALPGFFLVDRVVRLLGAEGLTAEYGREYLEIFSAFMPFCCLYYTLDNYLRDCGRQRLSMTVNVTCSLLNVALDALFVIRFGWGLRGAGFASCLSMTAGTVWSLIPFLGNRLSLRFRRGKVPLSQMRLIISNGFSDFFVNAAGSLLMVVENCVLLRFGGSTAVAASSIIEYAESLTEPLLFSIPDSLQPAVSYCYGAGLKGRMKEIQGAGMVYTAALSVFCMLFLRFGGECMIPLFVQEGNTELYDMTLHALNIYCFYYLVKWIDGSLSCYMTALEKPGVSLLIALFGTVIFPAVCITVLVTCLGLDGFWMFWTVSGFLSAVFAVVIVKITPV